MGHPGSVHRTDGCVALHVYVSAVIRERRAALGITQGELAERLGSHRPIVARVESGRHEVTLRVLEEYAAALGCTCAELVSGAEALRAMDLAERGAAHG